MVCQMRIEKDKKMKKWRKQRKFLPLLPMGLLLLSGGWVLHNSSTAEAQNPEAVSYKVVGLQKDGSYIVPTGQTITPAGSVHQFNGRPVDMALSPDGKILALLLPTAIRLYDTTSNAFIGPAIHGRHNFGGIVLSPDGSLLFSSASLRNSDGKNEGAIEVDKVGAGGKLTPEKPIFIELHPTITPDTRAKGSSPCGLAIAPDGRTLYVSLFDNSTVAAVDLTSYNPSTGTAAMTQTDTGSSPEAITVSPDGKTLYVADRGGRAPEQGDTVDHEDPVVVSPASYKASTGEVTVINTALAVFDPAHAVTAQISVGIQPTALALSRDGSRLYVACSNSDQVSVVDTATNRVVETINTSPAPGHLGDSSPNGLAVSGSGNRLFVSLGGDNAVEVLKLDTKAGGTASHTSIQGLIPTAWFPIDVVRSPEGNNLYVANSKGYGSLGAMRPFHADPGAPTPAQGPGGVIGPAGGALGHSVYNVVGSLGVVAVPDDSDLEQDTQIVSDDDHFDRMADALKPVQDPFWSRFKHVIMIIKENRTYDQVFGDMPTPPGTPGGDPNLVMFGENITPNHHALARQFGLFDNLYCSGEISADGHHWVDEGFADDYDERALDRYPRSYPCCGTDPLSFAGTRFLWQAAMRQGISFRDYGEYGPLPSIARHADTSYNKPLPITASRSEDVNHAFQFISNVKKHGLAQLTYLWFPNDHTSGLDPGAFKPESDVADNDLALGMLVSYISHSKKYWHDEPTAIFVVEDDAQGGLDHIDGHRTVGLVISPFNKPGQVNSSCYNQLTMERTMELMLGMPPQNQFDAAAVPMRNVFETKGDFKPYNVRKNRIALNLRNPQAVSLKGKAKYWAEVASRLNFKAPDLADPNKVTAMLWFHTHGNAQFPPADAAR